MAIEKIGNIKKYTYCPNCFSLIQWDSPQEEKTILGNKRVICPECGKLININKAKNKQAKKADGITLNEKITSAIGARYEGTGEYRTVLYYEDNTSQTIRPYDSDSVKALVDSVIIDGEDVTDTAQYSYTGLNIEEGTKVSMTFTATIDDFNEKTVSKTVILPYRSE